MTVPDTRAITLVDIPLIRRLSETGTVLDSERRLTRDARGAHSALLSTIVFPRGVYTLVARSDTHQVVGQFRYRPDDLSAHIVYIAPTLEDGGEDTVWLHILDAMAREAGRHGAHSLVAEVEPTSRLYETMRQAHFATYARQTIWHHDPVRLSPHKSHIQLSEETGHDQIGILSLLNSTIPTILHQVAIPSGDIRGLVYRKNGQVEAFIAVSEGDQGIYLLPYIHPDVSREAADIIEAAVAQSNRAHKVPIYVCVRSYQCWLDGVMEEMNFEAWVEQAVMVKHIAAGIRHPSFARPRVRGNLESAQRIPPVWSFSLHDDEEDQA